MKEKERVSLDDFLRKMIELMNSRFNKHEGIIDSRTKKQNEIINELQREITRLKGRITSLENGIKLSVDETILKDLGFKPTIERPTEPPVTGPEKAK